MQIEILRLGSNTDAVDLAKVAKLHQKYLEVGLLSKLGKKFLILLYSNIIHSTNTFLIVARDKESKEIVGFCSGAFNTTLFYKKFFINNFFPLIRFFVMEIGENKLNLIVSSVRVFFSEIASFLFSPKKNTCLSQLLSLVVEETYQKSGVGHQLFKELVNIMESQGISEFFTIAASTQEKAHLFYKRQSGIPIEEVKLDTLVSTKYLFSIKARETLRYGS